MSQSSSAPQGALNCCATYTRLWAMCKTLRRGSRSAGQVALSCHGVQAKKSLRCHCHGRVFAAASHMWAQGSPHCHPPPACCGATRVQAPLLLSSAQLVLCSGSCCPGARRGGEGGAKEPGPHGRALWRVGVLTATLNNGLHSVHHRYRTSLQLYIGLQHSLEGHMFDCGSRGINLCCRKGSGCGSSGVVPAWGMPGIRDTQKYTASRCCSPRGVLMLRCCTVWLRSAALAAGCVAAGARYACCC